VEVLISGGGFANCIEEYLHWLYAYFEHEIGCGGGSGDGGGSLGTKRWRSYYAIS
jgi:hypothetical protein